MNDTNSDKNKILVVEDETVISSICTRILNEDGYTVDIAIDGKEAQAIIQNDHSYTYYIIDIRTPSMNGMELYQWMEETFPQIVNRVIFTTGDVMGGEATDFIEETGRVFLPKPFTPNDLKEAIKKASEML